MFYFKNAGKIFCINGTHSSGIGRLINHNRKNPILVPKIFIVDQIPRLVFLAKRSIAVGDELCYDYGERSNAAVASFPWLKQ